MLLGLRPPGVGARPGKAAAAAAAGGDGGSDGGSDDDGGAAHPTATWASRRRDAGASAAAAFRVLFTVDAGLLSLMYFFSGLELSFWTGEYTLLLPTSVIGLVMTFAGVGEVIGGLAMGRLSDVVGRSATIMLASALYAGGLGIAVVMRAAPDALGPAVGGAPLVAYVAALLFGLADAGFNTSCYAICAELYDARGPGAAAAAARRGSFIAGDGDGDGDGAALLDGFGDGGGGGAVAAPRQRDAASTASVGGYTVFQLLQNLGSAAWYFVSLQLPLHDTPATDTAPAVPGSYTQVYMQVALLAAGTAAFVAVDVRHRARVAARAGAAGKA